METIKRTRQEIEQLKQNWVHDPIWDIESTEGYEAHFDELLEFHIAKQREWEQSRAIHLLNKAEALGAPGNVKLASYVIALENTLQAMQSQIDRLMN